MKNRALRKNGLAHLQHPCQYSGYIENKEDKEYTLTYKTYRDSGYVVALDVKLAETRTVAQ